MCERIHQLSVYSAGVVWDGDRADYTLMNHSRREPFQQPAHTRTKQGSAEAGVEGEPLFVHPPIVICKPEEPGRLYLAQGASSYNAAPLTTGSRDRECFWEQRELASGGSSFAAIFTGLDLAKDLEKRTELFSTTLSPRQPCAGRFLQELGDTKYCLASHASQRRTQFF